MQIALMENGDITLTNREKALKFLEEVQCYLRYKNLVFGISQSGERSEPPRMACFRALTYYFGNFNAKHYHKRQVH